MPIRKPKTKSAKKVEKSVKQYDKTKKALGKASWGTEYNVGRKLTVTRPAVSKLEKGLVTPEEKKKFNKRNPTDRDWRDK